MIGYRWLHKDLFSKGKIYNKSFYYHSAEELLKYEDWGLRHKDYIIIEVSVEGIIEKDQYLYYSENLKMIREISKFSDIDYSYIRKAFRDIEPEGVAPWEYREDRYERI